MEASKPFGDADELLARMQLVRESGYCHADELHSEARRLLDWREYVRSKPLMSIAVASLIGFRFVRGALRSSPRLQAAIPVNAAILQDSKSSQSSQSSQSSWKSVAFALAANVASTAAKHYLVSLIQPRRSEGGFNDRFRNSGSKEQSIGSASKQ